jgi:signal recognition particle subunit SRP54
VAGEDPLAITRRAMTEARRGGYDAVLLDTAGRQFIDEELMNETAAVRDLAKPHETLLVADALTGQDAVNLARSFNDKIGITGIVLTRIDGDGRGGAALSMRAVTGKPIKLIGTGERLEALEEFHPERIASRILGMGDVVSLVERASESMDAAKANRIAQRMKKGAFDLEDLSEQLGQMRRLGGMAGVLGMLPGVGKIKKQLEGVDLDNLVLKRQTAIIGSMTRFERRNPKVLNAQRKRRIAAGSGTSVQEVNRLLKMHMQMADMMKRMGRSKGLMGKLFGGGEAAPDAAELERMQAELAGMDPTALPPELRPPGASAPKTLPGLGGGGLPGLGAPRLPGLGDSPFRGFPLGPGKKR